MTRTPRHHHAKCGAQARLANLSQSRTNPLRLHCLQLFRVPSPIASATLPRLRLGVASREYDLVTSTDVVEQTFIAMISAINAAEGIASFPTQCDEVIPFMDAVGALVDALPAGLRLGDESGYSRLCFWPISICCM